MEVILKDCNGKKNLFYASDILFNVIWHFGVLLYSMRLMKCLQTGPAYVSPYPLSPQPSLFCLKLVCSSGNFFRSFPPGSVTIANPNFSVKVVVWGWPSHFPLNVAHQFLPSSETAKKCSASAETAIAQVLCSKVGLIPPVGLSLCFGKQQECLEIYCWLPYLCSIILHMSDSTRSLTAASGILQSLTFTRQQFTVVELTTYL